MADNEPHCLMPCLVSRAGSLPSQRQDGAGQVVSTVAIERPRPLKDERANLVSDRQDMDTLKFVQVVWGILLRAYTGSDDVCFRVVDGNKTQIQTHATAVYRANITYSTPVRSLLETDAATLSIGLDRLSYNTGVCYADDSGLLELGDMDIVVRIQQTADQNHSMDLWYKASSLSHEQAQMMANTVGHLLSETEKHENGVVGDINVCSDADLDLMKLWNKQFVGDFSPAEGSVHEVILRHCRESPDAVAVSAWDGDMTYGELERYSAALAAQLIGKGVKPEDFVPLCFHKSKWVAVAVLGVLRAGGAFVLLETFHPADWLQNICKSVNATVVLCAPDTMALAKQLATTTIPLIPEDVKEGSQNSLQDVSCHPSSALYAVFTSGSTGKPKGIVMEHGAFCASTKRTADALAMGPNTRRLQFASHAFTMCNREILMVLMLGGCLCIPSAHQRIYDLVGFMNRHRVNYANMTPSMAVMLSPEAIPGLQVLLLGGEAMGPSLLGKWAGKAKVLYGYGASETSGVAVLASDIGHDWDPHNLGFARDSALWVTEVDNPHRLAPIGAVGELLIQGRGLARCYLGDEERNRQMFLNGVEWLDPGQYRLYRTGDLVRYNVDGSLYYVGRRDKQIKLNGQLVDLNHVEHELQRCMQVLALDCQRAAIVAIPAGGSTKRRGLRIVAVLGHGPQLEQEEKGVVLDQLEKASPGWTAALKKQLAHYLPRYMIPSHFVFCNNMPMTKSGKANRPKLMELVTEFLTDTVPERKTGPEKSKEEHALSEAWNQALGGQPLHGDDFFRKGGDSIAAIQLIARLREEQLVLTVGDIFRERTFQRIAAALRVTSGMAKPAPLPFSLYTADTTLLKTISEELGVDMGLIEDLYPCTPMQETLMAACTKDARASIAHRAWTVPGINLSLFKEAWSAVWRSNPILRSRIVREGYGMLQVVTRTDMPWTTIESLDELEPLSIEGGPLIQLAVKSGQPPSFHLNIHHAICDAWSLNLVCKQVQEAYNEVQLPTQTFSQFIPYLRQNAGLAAAHFWRHELSGFKGRHFPEPAVAATAQKQATMAVAHAFEAELTTGLGYTPATFLRLAWAIVLAQETGSPDVIFGAIVTGRSAALEYIDKLSGPTLALVPVRVQLGRPDSIDTALQGIQDQASRMTPYEQTGPQHIAKIGDDIASASNFQNVMVIHQRQRMEPMQSGPFAHPVPTAEDYLPPFISHPFLLVCRLGQDNISLQASFDPCAVSSEHARRLLHQLAHVFKRLTTVPLTSIADVSLVPVNEIFQHQTLGQLAEGSRDEAVANKSQCKDPGQAPSLAKLEKLQRLVAKILELKESRVTASSDFFDLGGDSITCLQLVVQAKREGMFITEQAVFDNPKISALAGVAKDVGEKQNDLTQTRGFYTDERLRRELPVDILPGLIEVLPTTQFQRMSNSMMNYRYYRIQLPAAFDKPRLLRACEQLVHRHAILRTGFFRLSSGEEVQLVLQPGEVTVHESHVQDLDAHCRHDGSVAEPPNCGKPPFQVQLVTLSGDCVFLVFRLAHALFDGLSMRLIGEDIASLYNGQQLPETNPLSVHLRATLALRTDAAFNTWRRVLEGSQVTRLAGERLPVQEDETLRDKPAYLVKVERQIAAVSPPPGFTLSSLLKAAWAMTLAESFASRDPVTGRINPAVVFGQVVHGRGVGVPHEDRILGPCISIVPVRVDVDQAAHKTDLLAQTQQQMIETMPYTALGFDDIRENCTAWPKTTRLPSFLRVRNYQFTPPCWFEGVPCEATHYGIPNKPSPSANVHVIPLATQIHVEITISSHVLGPRQVGYLLDRFCRTIPLFDVGR